MSGYAAILELVRARAGLTFPPSRLDDARAGVIAAMEAANIADADVYLRRIATDNAPFEDLVAELTIGETYFCRDIDQFTALREQIVPDLVARHGAGHAIRTWSAGCASGEEAYSLAILFLEEKRPSDILATDISPRALAKAHEASYGEWALRGAPAAFRDRWFRRDGDRYVLIDEVRTRVRFATLNLACDPYPSHLDLILCRNVLIYLDAETTREVGLRLMRALAPGGWLLLGASDPMPACIDGVERVTLAAGVAYRRTAQAQPNIARPRIEPLVIAEPGGCTPVAAPPAPAEPDLDTAIAYVRTARDVESAREWIDRFPLSADLHLLHALLLLDRGHDDAAETALRRALFLDRTLAAAHFALGALLRRRGNQLAARRSFLNALVATRSAAHTSVAFRDEMSLRGIRAAAEIALRESAAGATR